jgi:hypothetical protein
MLAHRGGVWRSGREWLLNGIYNDGTRRQEDVFGGGAVLAFGRIKTGGRMVYSCRLVETLASPRLRGDEANTGRRCDIG